MLAASFVRTLALGTWKRRPSGVYGALLTQDERRILFWSKDHTPRLWDAATGQQTYKNGAAAPLGLSQVEGQMGLAGKQDRRSMTDNDDAARLDAGIVELFADKAEG